MTRYTRIILMDDTNQGVREYTISRRMVWILGILGLLCAGLLLWVLLMFGGLVKKANQIPVLKSELLAARADMMRLGQLQEELDIMRGMQQKVLLMLGVEPAAIFDPMTSRAESLLVKTGDSPDEGMHDVQDQLSSGVDLHLLAAAIMSPPPDTWPVSGHVTNEFSEGDIPRGLRPHQGIDIAGPEGAPILAAGDGVVARSGNDPFLGIFVEIQHGLGYLTVYGHCRSAAAERGQQVRRGQVIAYIGSTGQATAPHLHFEIWHNGVAVDPRQYLSGEPPSP
jgi:hypothetical protein